LNIKTLVEDVRRGRAILQDNITIKGLISDVTLLHPVAHAPNFPMEGPFQMTSLIGTHVNSNCDRVSPGFITGPTCSYFSICLSDSGGQMFGGTAG